MSKKVSDLLKHYETLSKTEFNSQNNTSDIDNTKSRQSIRDMLDREKVLLAKQKEDEERALRLSRRNSVKEPIVERGNKHSVAVRDNSIVDSVPEEISPGNDTTVKTVPEEIAPVEDDIVECVPEVISSVENTVDVTVKTVPEEVSHVDDVIVDSVPEEISSVDGTVETVPEEITHDTTVVKMDIDIPTVNVTVETVPEEVSPVEDVIVDSIPDDTTVMKMDIDTNTVVESAVATEAVHIDEDPTKDSDTRSKQSINIRFSTDTIEIDEERESIKSSLAKAQKEYHQCLYNTIIQNNITSLTQIKQTSASLLHQIHHLESLLS